MNAASLEHTLQYDMQGIVSALLSPQAEVSLQAISGFPNQRSALSSPIALMDAEKQHPSLLKELKAHLIRSEARPYSIELDTSALGTQTQGCNNRGAVIVLPSAYAGQMTSISNQKPTLALACSIDYRFQEVYLCWQSDQDGAPTTHDLWLPITGSQIIDEAWLNNLYGDQVDCVDEERYCWTDILVVCGERIVVGGFWTSTMDSLTIQVQSSLAINFKPHRYWSDEELARAAERATYLGTVAPWNDEVCINESGRRYCRLLEPNRRQTFRS